MPPTSRWYWYNMSDDTLAAMKMAAPMLVYIKRDIHGLRHLLHIIEKDSVVQQFLLTYSLPSQQQWKHSVAIIPLATSGLRTTLSMMIL